MTVDEFFDAYVHDGVYDRTGADALHAMDRKAFYHLLTSGEFLNRVLHLVETHPGIFGDLTLSSETPDTSREAWVMSVSDGDTDLGYEDWAHEVLCAFDTENDAGH